MVHHHDFSFNIKVFGSLQKQWLPYFSTISHNIEKRPKSQPQFKILYSILINLMVLNEFEYTKEKRGKRDFLTKTHKKMQFISWLLTNTVYNRFDLHFPTNYLIFHVNYLKEFSSRTIRGGDIK